MSEANGIRWRFGPFELAPDRGVLLRSGSEIPLPRKSFELLVHILRHRRRVVSKAELLQSVWPGVVVSDAAFASVLRDLRRALGDVGRDRRYVATVRGRGLRFVPEVREIGDEPEPDPGGAWADAAVHFERALRALERMDASRGMREPAPRVRASRTRGELLVALARARWSAGATAEARSAFLDAADVARRTGDAEVLAEAALGFVGRTDVTLGVNREGAALLEEALQAYPARASALRAELLARLGTELYYEADGSHARDLTRDALRMAEWTGDATAMAYACTARHFALQRPDVAPQERLPLSERVFDLLREEPPCDVMALALQERLVDLLELGEGERFEETIERYEIVVDALDQPFFRWIASLLRGTQALLAARVDEAEDRAHAALALGRRIGSPNAEAAFVGQLFGVRREQGRLAELCPSLEALATADAAVPLYQAAWAAAGDREAAERALERVFVRDLDDLPRDHNWVPILGTLAPPVAASGSVSRIRRLLELLRPYAGRMIVVGHGATLHGAVSHHMGLLHAALGEFAEADRHLVAAEDLYARAKSPLWLAQTRRARMEQQIPG